jgi:tight adherence protein B
MRSLLIAAVAFAGIFMLEAIFYTFRFFSDRKQDELRRRLHSLGTADQRGGTLLLREGKLSGNAILDGLLRGVPLSQRLELLLEQAEIGLTVARLLGYALLCAAAAFTLGLLSGAGPLLSLVLVPVAGAIPFMLVLFARERRSQKISEQLPDALDMMARSLRAGHALSSSFKMVANEMPQPINVEFGRAFEEQNLGMAFERAVAQMTKRAPSNRDLKIFAVSVIVQKETGGNLVEIIEKIAETIRARYRFFGRLNTLTAEGRMSSYILGALPILTGLFIGFTNRPYVSLLFTDKMGNIILGYAFVSWLLGFLWMRRMSKVAL